MLFPKTRMRDVDSGGTGLTAIPLLSVVVPVHNAQLTIGKCLEALLANDLPRSQWELIVVDDSSTDTCPSTARRSADDYIQLEGGPRGPAYARNRGAEVARTNIFCFVDSDVCVHASALSRILDHFSRDPGLSGVFGSYDDRPEAPGFVSQYRNLLHHYIHHRNGGEVGSFWAGCGALTRTAFVGAGGFDHARYPRAQIEDVELGYRVRDRGGRIFLDPQIQGTHLKEWRLAQILRVDFGHRGVPWMELLLERGQLFGSGLSIGAQEKISVVLVGFFLLSLVAALLLGSLACLAVAGLCVVFLVGVNQPLLVWFARVRGAWFAVRVVPMLVLYHATNVAAALYGFGLHALGRMAKKPEVRVPR